ncbi:MAG: type II toxin-antitoxin system HipA family toxin [Deltaproteobacteria bacterium]
MPEETAGLDVYFRDRLVGSLRLDEQRRFVFQYETEWIEDSHAIPMSISLPLRLEPYAADSARPFFANLLPEGEIRRLITRRFGVSERNDYALLEKIGGECAGAFSILPQGLRPAESPGYSELDEDELHKIIAELPRKPLLAGEEGVRLSLAGAQNKLPVYMESGKVSIARGNSASTHIIKLPIPGFEETVENEAFCMALAGKTGLPVPWVFIRKNMDILLVVERYDRRREPDGKVVRLHQEDFCQALGILPDQKYESEGGPSLQQCFTLIRESSIRPAADQKTLLSWVIFNTIIGNADAHAKNLAILYTARGPQLAPFYDLLSTQIYPELSEKYAMKIGGENRADWLQLRHWEKLADALSLKKRFVLKTVRDTAAMIISNAETIAEDFHKSHEDVKIIARILTLIQKRASAFI